MGESCCQAIMGPESEVHQIPSSLTRRERTAAARASSSACSPLARSVDAARHGGETRDAAAVDLNAMGLPDGQAREAHRVGINGGQRGSMGRGGARFFQCPGEEGGFGFLAALAARGGPFRFIEQTQGEPAEDGSMELGERFVSHVGCDDLGGGKGVDAGVGVEGQEGAGSDGKWTRGGGRGYRLKRMLPARCRTQRTSLTAAISGVFGGEFAGGEGAGHAGQEASGRRGQKVDPAVESGVVRAVRRGCRCALPARGTQ